MICTNNCSHDMNFLYYRVGKSMLMDLFYTVCKDGLYIPDENISYKPISQKRSNRMHFHEFMLGKNLIKFV